MIAVVDFDLRLALDDLHGFAGEAAANHDPGGAIADIADRPDPPHDRSRRVGDLGHAVRSAAIAGFPRRTGGSSPSAS